MKGCKYARDCLSRVVAKHRAQLDMYRNNPREFWLSQEDALFGNIVFSSKRDLPKIGARQVRVYELSGNFIIRVDQVERVQDDPRQDRKQKYGQVTVSPFFLTKFDVEAFASYAGWPETTSTNASTKLLATKIITSLTVDINVQKVGLDFRSNLYR